MNKICYVVYGAPYTDISSANSFSLRKKKKDITETILSITWQIQAELMLLDIVENDSNYLQEKKTRRKGESITGNKGYVWGARNNHYKRAGLGSLRTT